MKAFQLLESEKPRAGTRGFSIHALTPHEPGMSSATRVAPDFRGASRAGGLRTRECWRLLRQVRRATETDKVHENVVADWGAMTVGPDLLGVSAQAPQAPPINLVPPSSS